MTRERAYWACVSVVMLALVAWPMVRGRDGFPLSNYPMFSKPRAREAVVRHAVGITSDGRSRPLPPATLGTDEVMQASQSASLASKSPARAAEMCTRIAAELLRRGESFADIAEVELRTDRFDTISYWQGERTPSGGETHARCEVPR
ncbi:MAG: hypothetical protein IAG13_04050 [Deltaproteobacteria bacterium]|nr:hypothetical protein [Nannocystaceae bacterium]